MATTKKIVKNYIYNTSYQLLLVLSPLITAPYISRVLGVTGVSIANYAYSFVTYFVLFGTLGSSLYGQREIAYHQSDPIKRSSILKEIVVFRLITVSLSIAIYIFIVVHGSEYKSVYLIMLAELISTAFDISWFFQGMEEFKKTVLRNVIVKIAGMALIFLLVKGPEDINMYALCMTVPTLIGNLSLWAYLPKYVVKSPFSAKSILKYIKPMLLLFIPQVAIEIYTVFDKTMLGSLASSMDFVGYYTNAQHIIKMLLQLITSLGVVMMPVMASAFAKKQYGEIEDMLRKSFNFNFILGFPMMFGIIAIADNFAVWFYGHGYEPVGPLMQITAPIIIFIGVSTILGKQYLIPVKKQKIFTLGVVTGAIVNFIMNLILIPKLDGIGACIGTVVAEFAVAAVEIIAIRKDLPVEKYFKENFRYLIYSLVMFIPVFIIGKYVSGIVGTFVQIAIGIIIYLGLLILTKDSNLLYFFSAIKKKFERKRL